MNDLIAVTYVALFFFGPLASIYFLLRYLNWQPRKRSLFNESFIAYVGWLGAAIIWPAVFFVGAIVSFRFLRLGETAEVILGMAALAIGVLGELFLPALAIVIALSTGTEHTFGSVVDPPPRISKRRIWTIALLVSILTTGMIVVGLYAFADIDRRFFRGSDAPGFRSQLNGAPNNNFS